MSEREDSVSERTKPTSNLYMVEWACSRCDGNEIIVPINGDLSRAKCRGCSRRMVDEFSEGSSIDIPRRTIERYQDTGSDQ